jgi:L-asparaginase / beta-aspartyl-peptidase
MNRLSKIRRMILILGLVCLLADSMSAEQTTNAANAGRWAIALHGGAGRIARDISRERRDALERSLHNALAAGKEILAKGGAALDAVERVVVVMEDDPQFNAGKGAVFTRAGTHELDASIMDGATLRCGAVAGTRHQRNPIKVARLVMERSPHVLLAGEGADAFATEHGLKPVEQAYFYTERRFRELQEVLKKQGLKPPPKPADLVPGDAKDSAGLDDGARGTVGCVALDVRGNLAAATSTGGMTGKLPGRIGDTPIIGAGNFADNKSCAVSCTGQGEEFIRHSIAARVAWLQIERHLTVEEAVHYCLHDILQPGDGGIIAIDREGGVSMKSTTVAMPRGVADSSGRFETAIWFEP